MTDVIPYLACGEMGLDRSQVPLEVHRVQAKRVQAGTNLYLDGCGLLQNIHGFGQYDNSGKEAADIMQRAPATDIPISCQAQSRGRRWKGETNLEHQGPSHDLDEMSLWPSRLFLSTSPSSPVFSYFL